MNGNYKIRSEHLKPLLNESILRAKRFRRFSISHIPREQNTRADRLANKGADASEKSSRY
jgi:ribonuclease HI